MIKLGTDTPISAMNMQMVSAALPRLMAAMVPSTTPRIKAKRMARIPRSKDTLKESRMVSVTGRLVLRDRPRSPCRQLPM